MATSELLRMFVLDVISDDYENLDHIKAQVGEMAQRAGLVLGEDEVAQSLIELIKEDLAKAYYLSEYRPAEGIDGVPPDERINDLYFWLTPKGKLRQEQEYSGWPFNSDGSLREGWHPPE